MKSKKYDIGGTTVGTRNASTNGVVHQTDPGKSTYTRPDPVSNAIKLSSYFDNFIGIL